MGPILEAPWGALLRRSRDYDTVRPGNNSPGRRPGEGLRPSQEAWEQVFEGIVCFVAKRSGSTRPEHKASADLGSTDGDYCVFVAFAKKPVRT